MKLRNKKTGVIIEPDRVAVIKNTKEIDTASFNRIAANYYSLAELNEEWEDYEKAAPLIKDEKIRKIIREWAGENDSTRAVYYSPKNALADSYGNSISFNLIFRELNHGAEYTIAELCGDSKEDEDEA